MIDMQTRRAAMTPALLALAALVAFAGCRRPAAGTSGTSGTSGGSERSGLAVDTAALKRDVVYLASDALEGRATGEAGNDSAAAYVSRRYAMLELERPLETNPCAPGARCPLTFTQRFVARSVAASHAGLPASLPTQNVVAIVRGSDSVLRDEYVVLGAHIDHLGRNTFGALDPQARDAIRNGADDNASGTAVVMELARLFQQRPSRRSIILAHFSGEELGLLGSQYFVEHPPVPLQHVVAMLNFDMVGRLRNDKLIVYGVATATELPAIVDSANASGGGGGRLDVRALGDGFGSSDHSSFYAKGIPVLHFFTDLHADYHRATDDAELIDAGGMARVVALAERVARGVADRPSRLTPVRAAPRLASAAASASSSGAAAYLGSIPDMGAADVVGVRLTDVRPGSPADKAGLREGDIIVEFAGKPVKDLYAYTDALRARKPGDAVNVVVLRAGARVSVRATLGSRGG